MASLPLLLRDHQEIKLLSMAHLFFSEKLAIESPSTLPIPNSVKFNLDEFPTSFTVCAMGVMLFFIFFQILDKLHHCLWNETYEQEDIELGDVGNHRSLPDSDWSHEATMQNNLWMLHILDGVMALLMDRQGLSPEDLENRLPLVNYKSTGNRLDECVICLEDFEEDELCRVFPVCKHVFHFHCIDNWLRNHVTCPICRNCISLDE